MKLKMPMMRAVRQWLRDLPARWAMRQVDQEIAVSRRRLAWKQARAARWAQVDEAENRRMGLRIVAQVERVRGE